MDILVADDDPVARSLLSSSLTRWGFDVIEVTNGKDAIEFLLRENPPPLAILDWIMPGVDGIEICRALSTQNNKPFTYIILLTSRSSTEDIVSGLEAGAHDYIVKPFDMAELKARVGVGKRVVELHQALQARVHELQDALQHIKTLQGILPICMHCHRIRTDEESWLKLETYIQQHTDAQLSHGLCPDCLNKYYLQTNERKKETGFP